MDLSIGLYSCFVALGRYGKYRNLIRFVQYSKEPWCLLRRKKVMNLKTQRATASLRSLFVGDALSMPVHWFYRTSDILRYFPPHGVVKMEAAPADHPSSIMSLHSTDAGGRRSARRSNAPHVRQGLNDQLDLQGEVVGDIILKGKRELWGGTRTHYHHGLQAGENTLNAHCARLMLRHLVENGGYDKTRWLEAYIAFMTADPAQHPDTYAESYHRGFFANLKSGKAADKCGAVTHDTPSMGALVTVAPLAFALLKNHTLERTQSICCDHVQLTHPDTDLMRVVCTYVELLESLLNAEEDPQALDSNSASATPAVVDKFIKAARVIPGTKLNELLEQNRGDSAVVGKLYSTACYITDSWPAVCYLGAKYFTSPAKAMLINTNLGGENAHRGSVLGTLVGLASNHCDESLFEQLSNRASVDTEVQEFVDTFC
ncbi:MAG: ADP-ribosylglycohydrolase [Granulosicoccus sp.]|jgi:ADP-ribosylglycohydrolase